MWDWLMSILLRFRHRSRLLGGGALQASGGRLAGLLRQFQMTSTLRAPMGRLRGLLTMQAGFKVQLAGRVRGSLARVFGNAYAFPSGATTLFTETFADSSFASRGWYSIVSSDRVASPAPSGMPGSLRMTWNAGQTVPSSGGMRMPFTATDRVYIKCQVAFSANWVGSSTVAWPHFIMCLSDLDAAFDGLSDNNLAMYMEPFYASGILPQMKFQDSRYIDPAHIQTGVYASEIRATGGANGHQGYADSWDLYTDGSASHGWYNSRNLTAGSVQMAPGNTAWHTFETETILNTVVAGVGQLDGISRCWWDGVLVWERTNLIMRTGTRPTLKMNQFLFTPYIGGSGSPVTQTAYIADLTVATARTGGSPPPVSAVLTGTATGTWYESHVVSGVDTLIVTLTNDTWVAAGTAFNAQRAAIRDGVVAATSPASGWNALRSTIPVTAVVRTSDTVVTITLPALASYSVTANETLTMTVPGSAVTGGNAIVATPTLTITEGAPAGGGTLTYDGSYLSTYEPVNANTLMADDFSRGHWYTQDYDTASNGGTLYGNANNLGWGGTIYANPITPAGAIVGGGVGLHGRQYAATSGYHTGAVGGRNMADHGFLGGVHVNEAYFRIYFQYQSDYNGGHEKQFDFTRGGGTGQLVALGYNYFGSNTFRYIPYLHQDDGLGSSPGNAWMGANLTSNVAEVNGHWYYLEMRVVMNTPGAYDGIYEFWMDDCGTDGRSGPGTPTKRGSYTDVKYRDTGAEASVDLGGIWIENWANEATTGTIYYANVYVSKAFVGFANPAHQP